MGRFLARFNPFRALLDLRRYLGRKSKYEVVFLFASLMLCIGIAAGFVWASNFEAPWKRPDIIYVQSWRLDRSDAEIKAQQKIDEPKRKAREAAQKKLDEENKAAFKRVKAKWDWLL